MTALAANRGTYGPSYRWSQKDPAKARNLGIRPRVCVLLGALIVLSIPAAIAAPSGAAPSPTLQDKARAIAQTIAVENARLASIGERYLTEHAAADAAESQLLATRAKITSLRSVITHQRANVTRAAIDAYINSGSETEIGLILAKSPDQVSIGQAYLGIAENQLHNTVAVLTYDEHSLSVASATAAITARGARQEANLTSADRNYVLSSVEKEQGLLTSVKGQLAALVAQQAAAAAAKAAAAQRATSTAATTSLSAPAIGAGPPAISAIATPAPSAIPSGSLSAAFAGIRRCESSGNYSLNDGNGYYGAYQFSLSTWQGLGGSGLPSSASPATQDGAAYRLYQRGGFHAWPECAAILGLF